MTLGGLLAVYAACIAAGLLAVWLVLNPICWRLSRQEHRRRVGTVPANDNHRLPLATRRRRLSGRG